MTANGTTTDVLQDTVGAVCVDDYGNVASAVSSGGIILKQPGRLGQVSGLELVSFTAGKINKIPGFYTIFARKMPYYITRQRSRPGRGQNLEAEA